MVGQTNVKNINGRRRQVVTRDDDIEHATLIMCRDMTARGPPAGRELNRSRFVRSFDVHVEVTDDV